MCPNTEFFLVLIFTHSYWIRRDTEYVSVFSPNAGKFEPEKLRIWALFTQWRTLGVFGFTKSITHYSKKGGVNTKSDRLEDCNTNISSNNCRKGLKNNQELGANKLICKVTLSLHIIYFTQWSVPSDIDDVETIVKNTLILDDKSKKILKKINQQFKNENYNVKLVREKNIEGQDPVC